VRQCGSASPRLRSRRRRSLILQKAGGLQGIFCYAAFAPTRGVGAFVAINQFNFGAAMAMAVAVNDMIAALAPR
jgi:serine-type D-Ala-D-Ala carboxypeptidase/endopeptidase